MKSNDEHIRYSRLPPAFRERIEAARQDPDLLDLTGEIAVLTVQLEDATRDAHEASTPEAWDRRNRVAETRARLIVAQAKTRALLARAGENPRRRFAEEAADRLRAEGRR